LNDLPELQARKQRGSEVLRRMRYRRGACLYELRHSGFADGQVLLAVRYINLSNPSVSRPWIGRIVDDRRNDGRWTQGRLNFRG
jgi:hypothetical protein